MITKAAYNNEAYTKDLVYTKSARDAWKLILNSVKKQRGSVNILLPAYIGFTEREGSGIFDPVEETKSKFGFYYVNEDLSINMKSLEELIKKGGFNVLLVVHYFGYCRNDLKVIKKICDSNDIVFVEDCAHAYHLGLSREGLGVNGDFSFYSVHKYLPVSTGGVLKSITNKIPVLELRSKDAMSIEPALQIMKSDYEKIKQKRRDNFHSYESELSDVNGIEIMYDLRSNEIPQSFPIRIKNGLRERLYFDLMKKGMPTIALYYRLIDDLDKTKYPLSHTISGEILNLPLHQDTELEDIRKLVAGIRSFLKAES